MPRIRTIKPEIAHDVTLARLSRDARYTLVLCISQADDYGLLLGNPRQLLGTLYPHDLDVSETLLGEWIAELSTAGIVAWRVREDGQPVLQVVNWQRHQKVDHPHKPVLRDALLPVDSDGAIEVVAKLSRNPRETLAKPSRTDLTTLRPNDHTTKRPDNPVSTDAPASVPADVWAEPPAATRRARAARAKEPPKYPHYPQDARTALYEVWRERVGAVDFGRFVRDTAPLFAASGPYAPLPELVQTVKDAAALEGARGTVHFLTSAKWAGNIAEWVKVTRSDPEKKLALLNDAEARRGGRR